VALTEDRRPPKREPSRRPEHDELGTMTLFEHLAELRRRLVICLVALLVTTVVAWFFYNHILDFMSGPYRDFARHHPTDFTKGQFVITGPLEGFTTRLKISAYGGVALASPVLLWELWRFVTPGLHKHEKRYIVPFVSSGIVLFALGVATAIFVFPKALNWLINVSGHNVVPLFSPQQYLSLYTLMCLVFGGIFMYPLLVIFLEIAEVVPSATWRRWRRPAIVVISVVAAVITPSSDPFSFIAMAVPMLLFYEGSILLGRILHK
jgi:sec-independent protein translocase protein TatC